MSFYICNQDVLLTDIRLSLGWHRLKPPVLFR